MNFPYIKNVAPDGLYDLGHDVVTRVCQCGVYFVNGLHPVDREVSLAMFGPILGMSGLELLVGVPVGAHGGSLDKGSNLDSKETQPECSEETWMEVVCVCKLGKVLFLHVKCALSVNMVAF